VHRWAQALPRMPGPPQRMYWALAVGYERGLITTRERWFLAAQAVSYVWNMMGTAILLQDR
jgi:hypothetical protein